MTNSNQKERFQTKIAMLEQNNQVLQNKCEEYLAELIRTRKALEIAVDALKRTDWCAQDYAIAQEALNKITALEQKD